ncbi:hypothetical protein ONZ43_g4244 [Nemania bipapillata]|uniref:Uncharacterized protein n=1 Tax=Nemania bipapillata TaxID=110536 RepID=A0ACC2IQ95_9PEZI|nr:hypothetical protein ONZ43_g4244 [Nemania bipapillata]
MDDTTTFVSELLNKLAELNQKVCDYREGMANEFQRYSQNLLSDAPKHILVHVKQVVADELHNYPALSPGFALDTASADPDRSAINPWVQRGRVSPPPVLPHTSGVPPNDGSPPDRNRDREFHGLFTPSYLPLLDVMQPSQPIPTPTTVLSPVMSRGNESNSSQEPRSPVQLDTVARQPDIVHHYTGETAASTASDDSVSRMRRSALRRSSSASTRDSQSLRRVRFNVEGEEVLTTVSPPTSPRPHDLPTSPPPEDQTTPIIKSLDYMVDEEDASILGNSPPRPKKISSTERLKALARRSTEDTSKWTVVGDIHDDDEEEEGLVMSTPKKKFNTLNPEFSPTTPAASDTNSDHIQDERLGVPIKEAEDDDVGGGVVDDIQDLVPPSSLRDKTTPSPLQKVQKAIPEVGPDRDSDVQQVPPSESKSPSVDAISSHLKDGNLEEDMFSFDEDEPVLQLRPKVADAKYVEEVEDDEDEAKDDGQATPLASSSVEAPPVTLYATSPAIPIIRPESLGTKYTGASVGSYKGKPFIIGVVRDEEVHRQAVGMGDVPVFVGSVDGRSGIDASESYRQAPYYNSISGSIGERLMEEAYARRHRDSTHKQE